MARRKGRPEPLRPLDDRDALWGAVVEDPGPIGLELAEETD